MNLSHDSTVSLALIVPSFWFLVKLNCGVVVVLREDLSPLTFVSAVLPSVPFTTGFGFTSGTFTNFHQRLQLHCSTSFYS